MPFHLFLVFVASWKKILDLLPVSTLCKSNSTVRLKLALDSLTASSSPDLKAEYRAFKMLHYTTPPPLAPLSIYAAR